MLDPLADKLLITAALVSLVQLDLAPAWMVAVIIGREFAVTVLRSLAYARGRRHCRPRRSARSRWSSQVSAILLLILGQRPPAASSSSSGSIALWVAMITAVVSAVDYYRRFNHVLTAAPQQPADAESQPRSSCTWPASCQRRACQACSRPAISAFSQLDAACCASARYSLFSNSCDQPLEVGQRLGRPLES